jgi:hypothetical protein
VFGKKRIELLCQMIIPRINPPFIRLLSIGSVVTCARKIIIRHEEKFGHEQFVETELGQRRGCR